MLKLSTAALVLCAGSLCGQTPSKWCQYLPRTLDTIVDQHRKAAAGSDIAVTADQFPSRIAFRYTGEVRSLPSGRRDFLTKYFRFLRQRERAEAFEHELQFQGDSGQTYWFPVQEATLPDFLAEVAPGDSSTLFLLWAGMYGPREGSKDWVFFVNEFTSRKSAAYWKDQLATCSHGS